MHYITKEVQFDAGHRVPNHNSKCRSPHGHRYRVCATIAGDLRSEPGASDEGMVVDFGDLKKVMTEKIHDALDHSFIIHVGDVVMLDALAPSTTGELFKVVPFPYIPTAENLALWCFEQLREPVRNMHCILCNVTVFETPTSEATYVGEA